MTYQGLLLIASVVFGATSSLAEKGQEKKNTRIAAVEVETHVQPSLEVGLSDKIYQTSVENTQYARSDRNLKVSPHLALFRPDALQLSNDYFEIPYSEKVTSIPFVGLGMSKPLAHWHNVTPSIVGKVDYTYVEGIYSFKSQEVLEVKDSIQLHWLQMSGLAMVDYQIPGAEYLKPAIFVGAGNQLMQQSGTLDGVNQTFWVPFYSRGMALSFFEQTSPNGDGFGGVSVGATYLKTMSSAQLVQGWSFDLGTNIRM